MLDFSLVLEAEMEKYALIINENTKECNVGLGTNETYYQSIGMTLMDVEQAYNGNWYLLGYAPEKSALSKEEQRENRARAYQQEVDPITAHIQRLRDEEGTEKEVAELINERALKVEEIKQRYPYQVEESNNYDSMLSEDESEVI